MCVVSLENCPFQQAIHVPLYHSPFLVTAPSVRNIEVGLGLEEMWCLFKDHFAVFFISSLPKVLSYQLLSMQLWEDLLKNLEILGMLHSCLSLFLL